jgi:uncharacterized protein (DUF4415 family)
MSKKRTSGNTRESELPYNPNDRDEVLSFWKEATAHRGVAELRGGRPAKNPCERKEQIALRLDTDVLARYRAQGTRWQTRMNAVLEAFRDASIRGELAGI